MSIMEKLGRAADEIGNAADEAFGKAKAKYEEKVTPEMRREIQDTFDRGVNKAEELLNKVAGKVEEGVDEFKAGYNASKDGRK